MDGRIAGLGLMALFCLSGCFTTDHAKTQHTNWLPTARDSAGPETIYIEYVVIERGLGHNPMNREVWSTIDEQFLSPSEVRSLWHANGLRIGRVSGVLPSQLDAMVSTPGGTIGSREFVSELNESRSLTIREDSQVEFEYRPKLNGSGEKIALSETKLSVQITPIPAKNGLVTLRIVPETPRDSKNEEWRFRALTRDHSETPMDRYNELQAEVTLSPRDYVVIGTWSDRNGTLGKAFLTGRRKEEQIQIMLLLRAGYVRGGESKTELTGPAVSRDGGKRPLSLAAESIRRRQ